MVLEVLERLDQGQGAIEALVDRAFARSRADHRDRRFMYELLNGVLRERIRLDYVITHHLDDPHIARNRDLMRVLEIGAYQVLGMDKVPPHAAVNEAVKLTKWYADLQRFSGVVNAVLRAIVADRGQVPLPGPEDLPQRLSIEYSHPVWLVRRWLDRYGLTGTRALLRYNNEQPVTYLRRRMRGISRQQFEAESRELCDRVPGYGSLYYRLTRRGMAPEDIRLLQLGACTVQSPSAGWVVAMTDPAPGDRIVDVCSAPGGKAALLAEVVGEEGSVCACDVSPARLRKVADTRRRMDLRNIYPLVCDGRRLPFDGWFDKALVDAPCSGTGVLQRHPDARTARMEDDIGRVTPVQEELLEAAAGLVGPGGVVVYATCSLETEENEQQVIRFLARHPEFALEKPPREIPQQYVDLDGYLRITPWEHALDGAFAARLRKHAK